MYFFLVLFDDPRQASLRICAARCRNPIIPIYQKVGEVEKDGTVVASFVVSFIKRKNILVAAGLVYFPILIDERHNIIR